MKIPIKYLEEIKKKYKNKPLTKEMIVKDLTLSYILQEMADHKQRNPFSPFKKIIFKGGTLLAKSYLGYHRISEDLDFTYKDNKKLNTLSNTEKKEKIKTFLKEEFLPALSQICEKYGFDFDHEEINKKETKYCPIKSNLYFNKFHVYVNEKENNPIKIEINFCEELFYETNNSKIIHLNPNSKHLIFPLKEIEFESYSIKEILIEKIRAIITRNGIKERDIYDLFLLQIKGHNVFEIDEQSIIEKIKQGIGYRKNFKKEIKKLSEIGKRLESLGENIQGEIKDMNLIPYNSEEYLEFFYKLKEFVGNFNEKIAHIGKDKVKILNQNDKDKS
jgi:predicted nucleotidyltransferase component of viral defense system